MIGSKFTRHFFNQSEVKPKPKPIVTRACTFSRALCQLRVITSSFDWFTGLPPSFLIGQSNYFGFGFMKIALMTRYCSHLLFFSHFCLAFFSCFDLILTPLPFYYCKKQIDVNFSSVCPVIDNEFRHNIVKVVCGSTRLSPRESTATLPML